MTHPPALKKPGDGRRIGVVGDVYRLMVSGEETDGRYAMFEAIVAPGGGPPPHKHSREEEGFYVLEAGQPVADGAETAPPPTDSDIENLVKSCAQYGIEIQMSGK